MLIDDIDALKAWLTKILSPICDADPAALAKYVVALVKKDKTEKELREVCVDQLEVFLQDKTKKFVDDLFVALSDKSYIQPPTVTPAPAPAPAPAPTPNPPSQAAPARTDSRKSSRSDEGSDEHRRKRSHSHDRDRDRDRGRERSPGRDRDRGRRNHDDSRRRYDGDKSGSRYGRYDSDYRGSGHRSRTRSRSRSPRPRSISRERRQRSRSAERTQATTRPARSRSSTPVQDDNKERDYRPAPSVSSAIIVPTHSDYHNRERPPPRPRCRDYDEKGFCMRGDLCAFDHGVDPVVLEDVGLGVVPPFNPAGGPPPPRPQGPPSGPHGPPPEPPGGPRGPPPGPPPPGGPHVPPRPAVPPHPHMPPMPQAQGGPRPPLHHQGPPPPPRGPPPPGGPPPSTGPPPQGLPHQGDFTRQVTPPPVVPRGPAGVRDSLPRPLAFQHPPPTHQPQPPHPHHRPSEYHPEPYNPEAPLLRNNQNDFWRGGRGRGANRGGNRGRPHGDRERDMDSMDRGDRMRQPYQPQPQHTRRDLVSIPTIPEPQEEEPPSSSPPNNNDQEGATVGNRTVVPAKRAYEEPEPDPEDLMGGPAYYGYNPQQVHKNRTWSHNGPPHKRPHFDFNRLGPRRYDGGGMHKPPRTDVILELRKVPREHNNIAKLNEHFSKFGHIVNLQVSYSGDPEAALITFQTNAQAKNAYHSTEPILNNRFIKVFWHKPAQADPASQTAATDESKQNTAEQLSLSVKDRLGDIVLPPKVALKLNNMKPKVPTETTEGGEQKKVTLSPHGLVTTVFNRAAMKKVAPGALLRQQKQHAGIIQKKKEQEQEVLKKKMEIQQRKQLLLHKQIIQQKSLIEKLEKSKGLSSEDKAKIMKTIKSTAGIIERLKVDLTSSRPKPAAPPASPTPLKTKQQAQKLILDTELDIIAKQNEGADTSGLRQRVAALKQQAKMLGLLGAGAGRGRGAPPARGRGVGRGRGRGRGRGVTSHSVDRRPKELHVTGYKPEESEAVIAHLSKDGGVDNVTHDETVPSMIISYQTRPLAEQAVKAASEFAGSRVILTWHKSDSGNGPHHVSTPLSVPDEDVLTAVTGQVLSRENSEVDTEVTTNTTIVEEEEEEEEEDILRVGEGEDEENIATAIDEHEYEDDVDEDLLLGVDEEEDEEDEERPWRR